MTVYTYFPFLGRFLKVTDGKDMKGLKEKNIVLCCGVGRLSNFLLKSDMYFTLKSNIYMLRHISISQEKENVCLVRCGL